MKVGVAGFAGSGKTTVFQWLTGATPDPSKMQQGQIAVAKIPDPRLEWLSEHFRPKKTTHATLELLDTPGLLTTERKDNPRRLAIMRDAGALLVVLNAFSERDVAGQLRRFREELLFADLEIVTGRIERLEQGLKKPPRDPKAREREQAELELLRRIAATLEAGTSTRELGLSEDEEKAVRSFQLLTLKPEVVLVNASESALADPLPQELVALAPEPMVVAARFELELEDLSPEEQSAFVADLLPEGADRRWTRDEVLRRIFRDSGHIVFFTVGEDECRAWAVRKGATAVEGAEQIHTDLARGFVRGEVVSFDDFKRVGSMKEAKQHGVYRLESKTYVLQDGDIMHVLAST